MIQTEALKASLIVLIGHGGIEYTGEPRPDQCTNCARAAAAADRLLAAGWRPKPNSGSPGCPCGHFGTCDHDLTSEAP